MGNEWSTYGLPALLCLAGFHGVFFYDHLLRKISSWALLQAGIVGFLLSMAGGREQGNPFAFALSWDLGSASLAILAVLVGWAFHLRSKYGTFLLSRILNKDRS